jgi:hypothetical protein
MASRRIIDDVERDIAKEISHYEQEKVRHSGGGGGGGGWGGGHAVDFARECIALSPVDAATIRAALSRLLDVVGPRTDRIIPRVDGRALVRELVSRRYAIHRAYQRQPQPRLLMVMPDMSGSCAHIARITGGVAISLARHDDRIVVAPTAWGRSSLEGLIGDVLGRHASLVLETMAECARRDGMLDKFGEYVAHWQALKAVGVTHLLVLGDVHGHKSYRCAAAAGVRVLWCDPNADTMRVYKQEIAMMAAYVHVRDASARAVADAISEAVIETRRKS